MSTRTVKIAPSILACDFARLGEEVGQAEAGGGDWIHVDVMDGAFVPNITVGVPVVEAVRRVTSLPLDVHLMIESPERMIPAFVEAGATSLTVHEEACPDLHRAIHLIRKLGARAAVALNPATPVSTLEEALPLIDMVLIMTVSPGFGGQQFIPGTLDKIRKLVALAREQGADELEIEVDGGISTETAPAVVAAGATVLVAGVAVFNRHASVAENITALRASSALAVP